MTKIIIITKTIEVLIRVIGPYYLVVVHVNEYDNTVCLARIIIIVKTIEVLIHAIGPLLGCMYKMRMI